MKLKLVKQLSSTCDTTAACMHILPRNNMFLQIVVCIYIQKAPLQTSLQIIYNAEVYKR